MWWEKFHVKSDGEGGFTIEWPTLDEGLIFFLISIVFFVPSLIFYGLFCLIRWLWGSTIGKCVLAGVIVTLIIFGITSYNRYQSEQDRLAQEKEQQRYRIAHNLLDDGTYEVTGQGIYSGTVVEIASEYEGRPVTRIGEDAFEEGEITSVTIPDSVTSIGDNAFRECENLTSIVIPNSVTNFGEYIFSNCDSLTGVTFPNIMESIPCGMFYDSDALTYVTIPNGVTRIEDRAFAFCDSLTSITIPQSVTYIGALALARDTALTTINYLGTTAQWEAIEKYDGWSSIDGTLYWDSWTNNYTVYCTDGIITK